MHPPKIFISATSGDLGSVRQIVKEALLTINCHPVEQTNFEPDARTVENMLHGKIGDCQALIHLCGMRYGAEPDVASLPPGTPRRSYTQMEYHIARQLQEQRGDDHFRVYTFICPEDFPYDPEPDVEHPEKRDLQCAHRSRLFDDPHLREKPKTSDDLRLRILALQEQVLALKQEQAAVKTEVIRNRHLGLRIGAGIILLLLGIGWGIHHLTSLNQDITGEVKQVRQDVTEVKSIFYKERKFMALILARANERIKDWESMTPAMRFDLALDQIAAEQKIPAKELRDLLDLYVQRVDADPDAEAEDKYYVLMSKQAYEEAATLARSEGQNAETRAKQQAAIEGAAKKIQEKAATQKKVETLRAIDLYQKEADALFAAARYQDSLSAATKAAALVDKAPYPLAWADAQAKVAFMHLYLAAYQEAEPLMREILRTNEEKRGLAAPETATALNNLAQLLQETNRRAEAEPLMRRVLEIDEVSHGKDHPTVAIRLNNLAQLYHGSGRLKDAELLMKRSLRINEEALGQDHPNVAIDLGNLANLYYDTNRVREAEPMMERALRIKEQIYGKDHPNVAPQLGSLARLYHGTNRLKDAESLVVRALSINEQAFGKDHPKVATDLNLFATLCAATNRLKEAEAVLERALRINEQALGKDHPNVAKCLITLSHLYKATNRIKEAEAVLIRALRIDEQAFGKDHPNVAVDLNSLVTLYLATRRSMEAETLILRALQISEQAHGVNHPDVATGLNNLAQVYQATKRYKEAEPMMKRALSIYEQSFGEDDPRVATALNNLASLYQDTSRLDEAEPLMLRALHINKQAFGEHHVEVATNLNNLAQIYQVTNRYKEAEALSRTILVIFLRFTLETGREHPHAQSAVKNYIGILNTLNLPITTIIEKFQTLGREAGWKEAEWQQRMAGVLKVLDSSAIKISTAAMNAYQKGDHTEAARLWKETLKLQQAAAQPDAGAIRITRITRMNVASCRIFLGEEKPAREELLAIVGELEAAKKRDSLAARARHHLARAFLGLNDKPAAIATLREALAIYKELPDDKSSQAQKKESEELLKELTK